MAFFKRARQHAYTPTVPAGGTTPVLEKGARKNIWLSLLKTIGIPLIPILLLVFVGQPALRIKYTYSGSRDDRTYHQCHYLALDGWHEYRPGIGFNQCPVFITIPFSIVTFLGGK